jgi:hypothetical protein
LKGTLGYNPNLSKNRATVIKRSERLKILFTCLIYPKSKNEKNESQLVSVVFLVISLFPLQARVNNSIQ